MFVFYVCESVSVFYVDSSVLFLRILCLSDITWYLSFSVTSFGMIISLSPSMLLQMALFHFFNG